MPARRCAYAYFDAAKPPVGFSRRLRMNRAVRSTGFDYRDPLSHGISRASRPNRRSARSLLMRGQQREAEKGASSRRVHSSPPLRSLVPLPPEELPMLTTFRRSRLASPSALVTLLAFVAPMLPARVARAQSTSSGAPESPVAGVTGFADGSAGLPPGSTSASVSAPGAAQTSYMFNLPTARGSAQPSLILKYNSSSGVGFAGVGWTLNTPSIVRRGTSGIPRFQDPIPNGQPDSGTDDFYIDGAPLLLVQANPPLPAAIPSSAAGLAGAHPWMLYRGETTMAHATSSTGSLGCSRRSQATYVSSGRRSRPIASASGRRAA